MWMLLLTCLFMPPQEPVDKAALFKEADAQWADYMKKVQKLEFHVTSSLFQDGKLTGTYEYAVCLFPDAYIYIGRTTYPLSDDFYSPNMPRITILRSRGTYYEEFQFIASREITPQKELSLLTTPKCFEWHVPHEKALRYTDDYLAAHLNSGHHLPLATGYYNAGNYRYCYHEFLAPENSCDVIAKHDKTSLTVDFKVNNSEFTYGHIKRGSFKLNKKLNWMLTESENEGKGIYIDGKERNVSRQVSSITYTTVDNITVPLLREDLTYMKDEFNKEKVIGKHTFRFAVKKFDDRSVLALTTYGLAERQLPPPSDPVTPYIIQKPQPPSLWQQIPLWAWLSALAITIIGLGYWIRQRRRIVSI